MGQHCNQHLLYHVKVARKSSREECLKEQSLIRDFTLTTVFFSLLFGMFLWVFQDFMRIVSKSFISQSALVFKNFALWFLEQFLDTVSCIRVGMITDFHFSERILALEIWLPIEKKRYPNITSWSKRMQSLPYFYEVKGRGNEKLRKLVQGKIDELSKKWKGFKECFGNWIKLWCFHQGTL